MITLQEINKLVEINFEEVEKHRSAKMEMGTLQWEMFEMIVKEGPVPMKRFIEKYGRTKWGMAKRESLQMLIESAARNYHWVRVPIVWRVGRGLYDVTDLGLQVYNNSLRKG